MTTAATIPMNKEFNITALINPITKKPFGDKYAGTFAIRRPTLDDKRLISLRDAAKMSEEGAVNPELIGNGVRLLSYIFTYCGQVSTADLPRWFNPAKMYDEDEDAVLAVWGEVQAWLATFRPQAAGDDGVQGSEQP